MVLLRTQVGLDFYLFFSEIFEITICRWMLRGSAHHHLSTRLSCARVTRCCQDVSRTRSGLAAQTEPDDPDGSSQVVEEEPCETAVDGNDQDLLGGQQLPDDKQTQGPAQSTDH